MIAFHRLCFRWHELLSLDIEWTNGKAGLATSAGKIDFLENAELEEKPDSVGLRGIPAMCWRDTGNALFESLQLRENTEYLVDITIPVSRDIAEREWMENRVYPLPARLSKFYRTDPPKRWQVVPGGVKLSGSLNFGSHIGIASLELPGATPVRFEVVCIKLGYFEDLRALLARIAEESINLLLSIDTPTSTQLETDLYREADELSILFNYRKLMQNGALAGAIEAILSSPHSHTRVQESLLPIAISSNPALDIIATRLTGEHFEKGGPLSDLFNGYSPTHLPFVSKVETVDTKENRYIKSFLVNLLAMGEDLHDQLVRSKRYLSAGEVYEWNSQLLEWLSHSLWREVGASRQSLSNSQVLQRREGYKDILECDLSFQVGLQLSWKRGLEISSGLDGDIRPISELYEYWCFFVLRSCLRSICDLEIPRSSPLYESKDGHILSNLKRGRESQIIFEKVSRSGITSKVYLFYNRTFTKAKTADWQGSYSANLHPDYSILLDVEVQGAKRHHWLHFDAKYRLDFNQWSSEVDDSVSEMEDEIISQMDSKSKESYKRGDLYKMHTYRDALLGTRGSYILFPGSGEQESVFIRHPNVEYPATDYYFPSVGAFQLRPTATDSQALQLQQFLRHVIDKVSESSDYKEEEAYFS
ncbi:DUF2357 domain-containing protein [Hymenobacter sp. 102]|uniref:DUF2357 domain-containing protein n=1 Tax=Hymenobacter sp. 102 TaxID=3403152 RepID=UPI003CFAA9C2